MSPRTAAVMAVVGCCALAGSWASEKQAPRRAVVLVPSGDTAAFRRCRESGGFVDYAQPIGAPYDAPFTVPITCEVQP
jgi:hypothetical protein